MPNTNEAVAENVRAQMGRKRLSTVGLAKASGINRMSLSRRLSGEVPFTVDELNAVAKALDTDFQTLLVVAAAS